MFSVPEAVKTIISRMPFIEEGLEREIINLSSLARQIRPEVEETTKKEVAIGSIIMALRRLSPKLIQKPVQIKKGFAKEIDITLKSNLFEVTYPSSDAILKKQENLFNRISQKRGLFLTITQGTYETTIIASHKIKKELLEIFNQERPVALLEDLSSLTIQLSRQAITIPGLFYFLVKTLAWDGISIIEIVSTLTEFSFILKNEDVAKAFSLLRKALSSK